MRVLADDVARCYPLAPKLDSSRAMKETQVIDKYTLSAAQLSHIAHDYTYHAPKDDQPERYVYIREACKDLHVLICRNTPASREQNLALTHLETAVFYANAAIARNE